MPDSSPVRFGIVGCGSASIPVCEALIRSPLTELVGVYDVNEVLANDTSQRFQVKKVETFDALLDNPFVDALYIAIPHFLLMPVTKRVLEAGKHALVEKPLALTLNEIDQLIELAEGRKLVLGVFYEMRYAPAFVLAYDLIRDGAIGQVIGVQIQTLIDKPRSYWQSGPDGRSVNPWRSIKAQAGGGVVLMNTSHLLDALFYVTGLAVTSVSAEIGTFVVDVEVEDTASATLRFNNGAIGSLMAGAHICGANNDERCLIYGTDGQIRLPDPYGSDSLQVYLGREWGNMTANSWHTLPTESVPVHSLAVEDFALAVQSKGRPAVNAHTARQVLAVVLAIYQSANEKRTVAIL